MPDKQENKSAVIASPAAAASPAVAADAPADQSPKPAWYLCELRGSKSLFVEAPNEEDAKAKYLPLVGVISTIHPVTAQVMKDYKPPADAK